MTRFSHREYWGSRRGLCLELGLLVGLSASVARGLRGQQAASYPPPKNTGDSAKLGLNIQRTMTLLATSTPSRRNKVRVLFYGQSITEQSWWKDVADDLKRRFPNADLVIENRALGGFGSQLLVKTAESDLYSFYPDLMIFHVYGAHDKYEDIIRRTRERTTAEVLIQTDHVTRDEDLSEATDPAKLYPDGKIWNSFMNYKHLPGVAAKYGCGLVDQRNLWKQYLRDNNLHAAQLLQDGVHQNAFGNYLMSEIVKAYLVRRDDTRIEPMNCDTVHTYVVGKDVKWKNGKLLLPFDGNRVDLIARDKNESKADTRNAASADVRIDGRRPSDIPALYRFTRALSTPGGKWPVILKLASANQPIAEDWTMDVIRDPADPKQFTFRLSGSKTGPDGTGRSDTRFVSLSGRVVILPEDWNVEYSLALPGIKPPPDKFTVRWNTVLDGQNTFTAPKVQNRMQDNSIENIVTVAQGLQNGRHTLEMTGDPETLLYAIRVYRPPFAPDTKTTAFLSPVASRSNVLR